MTDHEQPAAGVALKVKEIISRACWGYASGLNTGPVLTRPDRRDAAIRDGVQEVLGLIQAPTDAGGAVSEGEDKWKGAETTWTAGAAVSTRAHTFPAPQPLQQGGEVTREQVARKLAELKGHKNTDAPIWLNRPCEVLPAWQFYTDDADAILALFASLATDRDKAVGLLRRWREPDGQWSASIDTDDFLSSQTEGS